MTDAVDYSKYLEAHRSRTGGYTVLPKDACGTVGWWPAPWEAVHVNARSEAAALLAAARHPRLQKYLAASIVLTFQKENQS